MVCGRRREAEEEKEEPGIQNQKQEPHTKMWGINVLSPDQAAALVAHRDKWAMELAKSLERLPAEVRAFVQAPDADRALLEALVACLGQTGEDPLVVDPLGVPVEDPLSGMPGGAKRKAAETLLAGQAPRRRYGGKPFRAAADVQETCSSGAAEDHAQGRWGTASEDCRSESPGRRLPDAVRFPPRRRDADGHERTAAGGVPERAEAARRQRHRCAGRPTPGRDVHVHLLCGGFPGKRQDRGTHGASGAAEAGCPVAGSGGQAGAESGADPARHVRWPEV